MNRLLVIFISMATVFPVFAQERKHEIGIGIGVGTTSEIVDIFSDVISSAITAGMYSSNTTYTGGFNLWYKYNLTRSIGLGGTFVYEHARSDAYSDGTKTGEFNKNYYTLVAESSFRYLISGKFSLYGILGAGATLYDQKYKATNGSDSDNDLVSFNFQISPIAIRYGDRLGFFIELGFGYKGIISAGLYTRF